MTTTRLQPARRNLPRLYLTEARLEFLKLLRLPIYSISVLAFPIVFYVLFGTMYGGGETQGVQVGRYMVGSFGAAGVLSAALFGFGVGVATERAQGWMRLKRVSPMPPLAYFAAKLAMAFMFASLAVIGLTLTAAALGLATFPPLEWLRMYGVLMLGVFPFAGLGLAIGYLFGPNSAPVVINLLYMPLAFGSGLWMPFEFLPPVIQRVAEYLPTFHYGQLVLGTLGATPIGQASTHLLVLVGTTVAALGLAVWAYFRDQGRTFG